MRGIADGRSCCSPAGLEVAGASPAGLEVAGAFARAADGRWGVAQVAEVGGMGNEEPSGVCDVADGGNGGSTIPRISVDCAMFRAGETRGGDGEEAPLAREALLAREGHPAAAILNGGNTRSEGAGGFA